MSVPSSSVPLHPPTCLDSAPLYLATLTTAYPSFPPQLLHPDTMSSTTPLPRPKSPHAPSEPSLTSSPFEWTLCSNRVT
ncbi:hypothetical protein BDP27DRAFT_1331688 [Rhodocollybia butyracea]|uniref:Uncharacterized protein n=1 Tax=Rhodocollybia butyracea TaxID=206335 RepID=A0A9P5PLU4_9AGAR|nr:hypothetical protein BDP27DRAFT_1331688 [Rhodocollybia butyracea]